MADNFRTGSCTFDYRGGEPRWFIENTSSTNPKARQYDSEAARDKALALFRAGTEWAEQDEDTRRGLPNRIGTNFSHYYNVKYDPQSTDEQFRLFKNTAFPTGFVITNSEDPGSHWQGTFGGVERGLRSLRDFRSGNFRWLGGYGNRFGSIGEEIFDPEYKAEEPRYAIWEGTFLAAGGKSFFITDTQHPGRGWGTGIFSADAHREEKLQQTLDRLSKMVDRTDDGGNWSAAFNIADTYTDIKNIPIPMRLGFDAAQDDTAEQKLDALWDALLAKAKELEWCEDFDEFAKANGAPDRLLRSKVKVTVEIEVDKRIDVSRDDVAEALKIDDEKITNWEVIS